MERLASTVAVRPRIRFWLAVTATLGASADVFFQTTAAGSFFVTANPAGALTNLGGAPVSNFGWEFNADVPVPANATSWGRVKSQYRN